jgi:hypothetical protein
VLSLPPSLLFLSKLLVGPTVLLQLKRVPMHRALRPVWLKPTPTLLPVAAAVLKSISLLPLLPAPLLLLLLLPRLLSLKKALEVPRLLLRLSLRKFLPLLRNLCPMLWENAFAKLVAKPLEVLKLRLPLPTNRRHKLGLLVQYKPKVQEQVLQPAEVPLPQAFQTSKIFSARSATESK